MDIVHILRYPTISFDNQMGFENASLKYANGGHVGGTITHILQLVPEVLSLDFDDEYVDAKKREKFARDMIYSNLCFCSSVAALLKIALPWQHAGYGHCLSKQRAHSPRALKGSGGGLLGAVGVLRGAELGRCTMGGAGGWAERGGGEKGQGRGVQRGGGGRIPPAYGAPPSQACTQTSSSNLKHAILGASRSR
jgi:hypothetical protein